MFIHLWQFTMSSLSAWMITMNFGKLLLQNTPESGHVQLELHNVFAFFHFPSVSEDVLPSIHADPEYPCELVGTWNTWYGEQDQAGKIRDELTFPCLFAHVL